MKHLLCSLFCLLVCRLAIAQDTALLRCGQKEVTESFFRQVPEARRFHDQIESQLTAYRQKIKAGILPAQRLNAAVTLPVAVHIIHNNGTENISDALVAAGIQHLNEAFANTGIYDPSSGVNTQIQFCLAQRDPSGNITNGITRNVSTSTVMSGPGYSKDDQVIKNLNRWNPSCYINIWLVREIPGNVAGYAYLPSAHGSPYDGIVMEAHYFGTSSANSVVIIHEMGHYLGLYHTFEGSCKNDDCAVDGDRVCDTPPDQSTAYAGCNTTMNSCSTDALSGFSTDVNDLREDYMDYGNLSCMSVFTQGQADRMQWFIQNVRRSLLNCKSCLPPCPAPVVAGFTPSAATVPVGTTVNFTNNSVNASGGYRWYVNDVLKSTAANYSNNFNYGGTYIVRLAALTSNPLCDSAVYTDTIHVTCPITAAFSPLMASADINQPINFANSSTGATAYQWLVNGVQKSVGTDFSISFPSPGAYTIKLRALTSNCSDSISGTVIINPGPQSPGDTCSLKTFIETIGGQGEEFARDVIATSDGGHLIAGAINNLRGNNSDGLLVKINNRGQVEWTKTYGSTAGEYFFNVIAARNGDYIAVGYGNVKPGHRFDIFVARVDPLGNLLWAKAFGAGSLGGEIGRSVAETEDGGIAIAANYNAGPTATQPLFLKLDRNGNLLWNKLLTASVNGFASDIIEQDGALVAVGSVVKTGSTYEDGFVVKMRSSDGALIWTRNIESESRSNRLWEIRSRNNEFVFTMVNNDRVAGAPNNTGIVFKTDIDGNLTQARKYHLDGTPSASPVISSATTADGGSVIAVSDINNRSVHWGLAGADGNMQWVRNYMPFTLQNISKIISDHNGHTMVGQAGQDILLIKTNMLGLVKNNPADNCEITNGTGTGTDVAIQSTPAGTNYWTSDAPTTLETMNVVPNVVAEQLPVRQLCLDSARCNIPAADSCVLTSFVKTYTTADTTSQFYDMIETRDGHLLAMGSIVVPGQDGLITKLTKNGTVVWTKAMDALTGIVIRSAIDASDNTYVFVGSHSTSGFILLKTDYAGNVLWRKDFVTVQFGYAAKKIIEGNDGDYYILSESVAAPPIRRHFSVTRVTAAGALVWSRNFLSPANVNIYTNSMADDNDGLMISGQYWDLNANQQYGTIIRVGKNTAQLAWAKYYRTASNTLGFGQILKLGNNFIVNSFTPTAILKIDGTGTIISETALAGPGLAYGQQLAIDKNSDIIAVNTPLTGTPHTLAVYKLDADFNQKWVRTYDQVPKNTSNAITANSGDIFISSVVQSGLPKVLYAITKLDNQGFLSTCPPSTFTLDKRSIAYTPIDFVNATAMHDIPYNNNTITITYTSPGLMIANAACGKIDICSQLDITGPDTVCRITDSFEYRAQRSIGCYNKVQWLIDTSFAKILAITDSTIRLQFRKAGIATLKGFIKPGCEILQDSLPIFVSNAPDTLNLGPDIELCRISTWPLNARSGFRSYLWQDGSTDSTLTVFEPGLYHVTVTDFCGNQWKDSVNVTLSPEIPFDLGPDLAVCKYDSITLRAPAGFSNYVWSPGYNMVGNYSREIEVFPGRDTVYSVIAERAPGCLLTDSIRVTVRQLPAGFLADTARVCINQPAELRANGNFVRYRWDNALTSQAITVNRPGAHVLEVTDVNGCVGADTIFVVEKDDCGKFMYFPNAFTPNNDRFNNQFRPAVSGSLAKYHLLIYNRWGQKVFESNDPARGWDGVYNGTVQSSNTYVWVCTYKFAGSDQEKNERGMVTLIR